MSKRMQRRSRAKIILIMLKASLLGTTKTRLMIRSGLSLTNFDRYFEELLDKGLIEAIQTSHQKIIYKTTKKGRQVLKALLEANRQIEL